MEKVCHKTDITALTFYRWHQNCRMAAIKNNAPPSFRVAGRSLCHHPLTTHPDKAAP